jgi:DNA-directed RNA polymerase sigma subunit (sigma70/sigma32)
MSARTFHLDEAKLKDYILLVNKIGELSQEKMNYLLQKYESTIEAEDRETLKRLLIEYNLKLAVATAAKYRGSGLSFSYLIRMANKGLVKGMKAWEKEEERNDNFYSFIAWRIEDAVIDGVLRKKKAAQKNG